jgi:surfactin synthase thioesterase subunit
MSKQEQPYYAFMRQLGASHDYDCSNRFDEIDVPTLIMSDQKDGRVTCSQIEEMNKGIKGSKLIMFKGGHMFFLFENKRFTDCLMEFLSADN